MISIVNAYNGSEIDTLNLDELSTSPIPVDGSLLLWTKWDIGEPSSKRGDQTFEQGVIIRERESKAWIVMEENDQKKFPVKRNLLGLYWAREKITKLIKIIILAQIKNYK